MNVTNSTSNGTASTSGHLGWTQTPNVRGSIDIIYTCIAIFFLGAWNVLHLNIPTALDTQRTIFFRKLKWMFIALCVPELVTGIAFNQWRFAWNIRRNLKNRSWAQAWFFVSGGLRHSLPYIPEPNETVQKPDLWEPRVLRFCSQDGSVALHPQALESITLPDPEKIIAENKSDSLAKLIIIVQVTWFAAQIISRAGEKLPISQLEIGTVAFVGCTLMTTFFWWHKPLDIRLWRSVTDSELAWAYGLEPKNKFSSTRIFLGTERLPNFIYWSLAGNEYREIEIGPQQGELGWVEIDGPEIIGWDYNAVLEMAVGSMLGILFGSVHLAAWNFEFPSTRDKMLWRAGSLLVTLLPLCAFIFGYLIMTIEIAVPLHGLRDAPIGVIRRLYGVLRLHKVVEWWGNKERRREFLMQLGPTYLVGCYGASRLLLAVLMFKSFMSMPAGVYDTVQWADNILHI